MSLKPVFICLTLLTTLVLTACSPLSTPTPAARMDQQPTAPMMQPTQAMMGQASTPMPGSTGEMMKPTDAMMGQNTPAPAVDQMMAVQWVNVSLTHPVTGRTFKIDDFKGKVVLVEPFAQWCPTCLSQQNEVVKLNKMPGLNSDLVVVGLDIDPYEDAVTLKMYLAKNGFDWYFAVAPAEVSRDISQLFGNLFLNPPSAPMLIIDRKGDAHPLPFGVKSADELRKDLAPYF